MSPDFIRDRITTLRMKLGISEYQMSYGLGHSRGYINNITSGKTLPSMTEFLSICDYCHISPSDFFNESLTDPTAFREINTILEKLSARDLQFIQKIAERFLEK